MIFYQLSTQVMQTDIFIFTFAAELVIENIFFNLLNLHINKFMQLFIWNIL